MAELILEATPAKGKEVIDDQGIIDDFNDAFRELLCVIGEILKEYVIMGSSSEESEIAADFKFYCRIYDKENKPEYHYPLFLEIYNRHRKSILHKATKHNWLRNGNVEINYAKEVQSTPKCRIALSTFYKIALNLDETSDVDENYANKLLLNLYNIFLAIAPEEDMKQVEERIEAIEEKLKLGNGWVSFNSDASKMLTSQTINEFLGKVFQGMTPLLQSVNKDINMADVTNAIQSVITNVTQNPDIQALMNQKQA